MIHSFRPNKDTLLFNIKNIPLHLFNFIFIHLQKGGYTPYYILSSTYKCNFLGADNKQ